VKSIYHERLQGPGGAFAAAVWTGVTVVDVDLTGPEENLAIELIDSWTVHSTPCRVDDSSGFVGGREA
jgi:hypothetical protein